jgi:gliding motility-associated-like protein
MRTTVLLFALFIPVIFGFSERSPNDVRLGDPETLYVGEGSQRHLVSPADMQTRFQICGMEPGQTYGFYANGMQQDCPASIRLAGPGQLAYGFIQYTATASCVEVVLETDYLRASCDQVWISTVCQSCRPPTPKPRAGSPDMPPAIAVNSSLTPQQLVEEIFVGGGCFDVSNVSFSGGQGAIGSFQNGLPSIGLGSGIILTSGSAAIATGPNNQSGAGATSGGGSDPDLVQASNGGNVLDAAVLQFDFVPTLSQITFRYVFASEEYCEYANSGFNDVFGFFLSGPGINGPYSNNGINIATLPAPPVPVSINNVNHVNNPQYYVPNIPAGQPNCPGHPVAVGAGPLDCQYDGYTVVLTAVANVIPCQTYRIKLAIADVGDTAFDSAVFLEGNSFDAGGAAFLTPTFPVTGTNVLYEGCGQGFIRFTRISALNINLPAVINYSIGGTATPGVDYTPLPTQVIIPPGQMFVDIPITAFIDGIIEGPETILLDLTNACSCTSSIFEIIINEPPPLNVTVPDVQVCLGTPVFIQPAVSGGVTNYTYQWSNGSPGQVYLFPHQQSGSVTVTVTDHCMQQASATANYTVYELEAQIGGTVNLCTPGQQGFLSVSTNGTIPWNLTYNINGGPNITVNNIITNPYNLPVTQPGTYQIVAVVNGACIAQGNGTGVVNQSNLSLSSTVEDPECAGYNSGSINLNVAGNTGNVTYNWSNGANVQDPINLGAGTYTVTVTDAINCQSVYTTTLADPPGMQAEILQVTGVDCDNPTGGSIDLAITGGLGGYVYAWSNGDTVPNPTGLSAGSYNVIVTDASGCEIDTTILVPGDTNVPTADIDLSNQINCSFSTATLDGSASSGGANVSYLWTTTNGNIIGDDTLNIIEVDAAGSYVLTVTNLDNGCFATSSVNINENLAVPLATASTPPIINCNNPVINLNGTGSSSGTSIVYAWETPDGNFTSATNILNPSVDAPGSYTLIVTNVNNGCADSVTVVVNENTLHPIADAGADLSIDCQTPSIQVNGSNSSSGTGISYQWSSPDGNIVGSPTVQSPTVNQQGTYYIQVTNLSNGCSSVDSVFIQDLSDFPFVSVAVPDTLTCAMNQLNLDGSGTSTGTEFTYIWTTAGGIILDQTDPFSPLIGASGTYTLSVTNTNNGCNSTSSIIVEANQLAPVANAGASQLLDCLNPEATLDGSGSDAGPQFTYLWTATQGGQIVSGEDGQNPVVNAPGFYQLLVTNTLNGCTSTSLVQVQGDSENPVAAAQVPPPLNCNISQIALIGQGASTGPNFSYLWTTQDGNILSGETGLFPMVNMPGTYTLTVTNIINDCSDTHDVIVIQDTQAPIADAGAAATLTCAITSLTLDGNGSSQAPNMSITWTTNDGVLEGDLNSPTPTASAPGTYYIQVFNGTNFCSSMDSVVISIDITEPLANAGIPQTLTCSQPQLLLDGSGSSAGANFDYEWITLDGNLVGNADVLNPEVDAPGTYILVVENISNGCTSTASVVVDADFNLPTADAGTTITLTCSNPSLSLNGFGSSQGSNFSYQWSTVDGQIETGDTGLEPIVSQAGSYQLLVLNTDNGCSSDALVSVSEDFVAPQADAGATFELDCNATSIQLDGSGSSQGAIYSYAWSTNNGNIQTGLNSLNPTINAPGVYELQVTNTQNGCTETAQVVITQDANAPVVAIAAPDVLTCAVSVLTLDAAASSQGAGFTYAWSTANGNIQTGPNTLSPTVNAPGLYTLQITNTINNCLSQSNVLVTQDIALPQVQAAAPVQLDCNNTNVQLSSQGSSQGGPFAYSWVSLDGHPVLNPNSTTPQVSEPGTYQLNILNTDNGCSSSSIVVLSQDTTPPTAAVATPATLTCSLTELQLNAAGSSQGAPFGYLWTTLNGCIQSGDISLSPTINCPGTYSLQVTNNQNGCVSNTSVNVSQNIATPTAVANPAGTLTCAVQSLQLSGNGSSAGGQFSYSWTGSGITAGSNTLAPSINQPGVYVLVVVDGTNDCTASAQVTVNQDITLPTVSIANPALLTCATTQVQLSGIASGAGASYTYNWSSGSGSIQNPGSPTPTVNAPGTYTLQVTSAQNGCSQSAQVAVGQDIQPPLVDAGPSFQLNCNLPEVALQASATGTGLVSYQWSTNNGNITGGTQSASPTVNAPGLYVLTVLNTGNGCSASDQVTVTENNPQDFDFSSVNPNCLVPRGTLQFQQVVGGVTPYLYSIDGGSSFSGQTFFSGLNPGAYALVVQDANGCELEDQAVLLQPDDVVLEIEPIVVMNLGDSYQMQALTNVPLGEILSVTWTPATGLSCSDCLNPVASPESSQNYRVTIQTIDGCTATRNVQVQVNRQANVYVPNIFSPNADGVNDVFMIFAGNQVAQVNSFLVFNRWGETVFQYYNFQPNDPAYGWDGSFRGQPMNPAVFVWYAEIEMLDGRVELFKGDVTLVR